MTTYADRFLKNMKWKKNTISTKEFAEELLEAKGKEKMEFKVYDKVWFMWDDRPARANIYAITNTVVANSEHGVDSSTRIKLTTDWEAVYNRNFTESNNGNLTSKFSNEIFHTKEDLLNSFRD